MPRKRRHRSWEDDSERFRTLMRGAKSRSMSTLMKRLKTDEATVKQFAQHHGLIVEGETVRWRVSKTQAD